MLRLKGFGGGGLGWWDPCGSITVVVAHRCCVPNLVLVRSCACHHRVPGELADVGEPCSWHALDRRPVVHCSVPLGSAQFRRCAANLIASAWARGRRGGSGCAGLRVNKSGCWSLRCGGLVGYCCSGDAAPDRRDLNPGRWSRRPGPPVDEPAVDRSSQQWAWRTWTNRDLVSRLVVCLGPPGRLTPSASAGEGLSIVGLLRPDCQATDFDDMEIVRRSVEWLNSKFTNGLSRAQAQTLRRGPETGLP